MKDDVLKKYAAFRTSILKEKARLETRLAQINKVLAEGAPSASADPSARRVRNKLSLKAAVRQATAAKPLTKPEILAALQKMGYRFAAKDPKNSLNVVLYTKGLFRNDKGRFSPAG